jgi:type IV pilus assembly protein PilY1
MKATKFVSLILLRMVLILTSFGANLVMADTIAQVPLFLTASAPPLMMLTMSRDEQLFIKAYPDYTDIDGDGQLDTTYKDTSAFDYIGYFDPKLCYQYDTTNKYFIASANGVGTNSHQCTTSLGSNSTLWSGNFLNWTSMSRMDLLRFVLYGGLRSTDTSSNTVLERAQIPNDLHAWVKVYSGTDINYYTPYTTVQSFCSASFQISGTTYSQVGANVGTPVMRRGNGTFSQWASTAAEQCQWQTGNDPNDGNSNWYDEPTKPSSGSEFVMRVQVCVPGNSFKESFCSLYGTTSYKPIGLLQQYGQVGADGSQPKMRFGLVTGSAARPRSGGVLRRNIGLITGNGTGSCSTAGTGDEINMSDGTFCTKISANDTTSAATQGVINTLDRLRISNNVGNWSGSNWSDCNTYGILNRDASGGANQLNDPGSSTAANRKCSAWGNPITEVYAEALRYITADKGGPTAAFNSNASYADQAGLPAPTWQDPYLSSNSPPCAHCSILLLSSGLSSFDSDEIPSINKVNGSKLFSVDDIASATKTIGDKEGITGNKYLAGRMVTSQTDLTVGNNVTTYQDLCTSQNVTDLSLVRGICLDIPSQEGSFLLAGAAWLARTTEMRSDLPKSSPLYINTYSVALAENLPKFEIPVGSGQVTLAPLCQANNTGSATASSTGWRSCYLGSVTIGSTASIKGAKYTYGRTLEYDTTTPSKTVAGSYTLVWEDSQWGNDHDNDVVTMITYCVGSKCTKSTSGLKGTSTSYTTNYTGYDICWRSDSTVCGTDGKPAVNSDEILVRVENISAYAGNAMLTGYTISGSDNDGVKNIALRPGNSNTSLITQQDNPPSDWYRPKVIKFKASSSDVGQLQNPLWYAAKYGSFVTLDTTKSLDPVSQGSDSWNKGGTGSPDTFFKATNPAKLKEELNAVFSDVLARETSAAALATNSTRLDTNTQVYQAKFNSTDWSGELLAYKVSTTGAVAATPTWDTNTVAAPIRTSANTFTWNDATKVGVGFDWADLSAAQQAALRGSGTDTDGQNRLSWMLGGNVAGYRTRTFWLGDIVNSDPLYVGVADYGYDQLPDTAPEKNSYLAYVSSQYSRTKMLYVGANDGMLHALKADTGQEVFAYVPDGIYANLPNLMVTNYQHQFYVNGSPAMGDAYFGGQWHTVLVGTTAAGGSSIFAIDVTDPGNISQNRVLWNITNKTRCSTDSADTTVPGCFADLGYTFSRPTIGRMQDGTWVAVFGNGYQSANNKAVLYIVNISNGSLVKKIETCAATDTVCLSGSNGLSTPELLPDSTRTITAAYAGDLKGNMWKFDLSSPNASDWKVAFSGVPMFTATNNSVPQPITARPELGNGPSGGYMVYFGTGKFFESADNVVSSNPPLQAFYGLWDKGDNTTISSGNLVEQTITNEQSQTFTDNSTNPATTTIYNVRLTSSNVVNYNGGARGWFLTLESPVKGGQGERVINPALLRSGRVIFTTLIPSTESCSGGGSSWLLALDALSGGASTSPAFDFNNDAKFTAADQLDGQAIAGFMPQNGIISTPVVISNGSYDRLIWSGTAAGSNSGGGGNSSSGGGGNMSGINSNGNNGVGRLSWRQLQ